MYFFSIFAIFLLVSQGSAGDSAGSFRGFVKTGDSEVYSSDSGTVQLIPGVEVVKNVEKSTTPPCAKYVKLLLKKLLEQLSNVDFDTKPDSDSSVELLPEIENVPETDTVPEIDIVPGVDSEIIENPKAQCAKCFGKVTEILNVVKQRLILRKMMRF